MSLSVLSVSLSPPTIFVIPMIVNRKDEKFTGNCKTNKETTHVSKRLGHLMDMANGEYRGPCAGKQSTCYDPLRTPTRTIYAYMRLERLDCLNGSVWHHGSPGMEPGKKSNRIPAFIKLDQRLVSASSCVGMQCSRLRQSMG